MAAGGEQKLTQLTREEFVEQFSSYLKASFVYPSNNSRVIEPAALVVQSFDKYKSSRGMLRLCLHGENFRVGNERVVANTVMPQWMKQTFMKTGIAGVDMGPSLLQGCLDVFAKGLQEIFQRGGGGDFRSRWVDDYPSIRPLELLIDGQHAYAKDEDDDATLRPGGSKDAIERGGLDAGSSEVQLLRALESNADLLASLDGMRQKVNRELFDVRHLTGVDVLAQLVKSLPAEALRDAAYATECVTNILEVAEIQMVALLANDNSELEPDLFHLMATVGRTIFGALGVKSTQEILETDAPTGRPGDEKFQDDLDALMAEFEALPPAGDIDLSVDNQLVKDEMLGILVQHMVTTEDEGAAQGLTERIRDYVARSKVSTDLVKAYVDVCLANRGKPSEEKRLWRIVDFCKGQGIAKRVTDLDLMRVDIVAFAFPQLFSYFLDSLNDTEEDLAKISDVCYGVGPDRIRAARDILCTADCMMTEERVAKVLACPSQDLLPLVQLIIEDDREWTTRQVVQFFKRMKLPPDAGLALRVVNPASRLPKKYLEGLCQGALDGEFDPKLVGLSASLVCRFIRDLADEPERHDHRIYAIQSLRTVRNEEVLGLLMELKGVCGAFSWNKDLKAVRKVAVEVLDHHMAKKG